MQHIYNKILIILDFKITIFSGGLQPGEVAMPDDKNKDTVAGQAHQVTY